MKWSSVKTLIHLSALLLTADLFLVIIVARAMPANKTWSEESNQSIPGSITIPDIKARPIKVTQHPSTYFDPIKPVFTQFQFVGVQMEMPIGTVMEHAKTALNYVRSMPYFKVTSLANHLMVNNDTKSNNTTESLPERHVWAASMNHMINYKINSLASKINQVDSILEANAFTPDSFDHVMSFHQGTDTTNHDIAKREVDIHFDATSLLSTFFNGINAIFHWNSISELSQSVNDIQLQQKHLEEFTIKFANKVQSLLILLENKERNTRYTFQAILTSLMCLDEAEEALNTVLAAMTPLLQGVIPTLVLDAANLVNIYDTISATAEAKGLRLALSAPSEILQIKPFSYQRGNSWEIFLSLPVVNDEDEFPAYHLVNMPTLQHGVPTIWNLPDSILGVLPTLYPQEAKYVTVEKAHLLDRCQEYIEMFLCHLPVRTAPSCIADLFFNASNHCSTSSLSTIPIVQRGTQNQLFFFEKTTEVLVKCEYSWSKLHLTGLVCIEDRPGCSLIADSFSYSFVGKSPMNVFKTKEPRIVAKNLMPNVTQESSTDNFGKEIQDIINDYNNTKLAPRPVLPPFGVIGTGLGGGALLVIIMLMVVFCIKANSPRAPI